MAGINLMAYAQGAEMANQANWRDVLNEFSTAQQQQNLTQQQAEFGLNYPLAQETAAERMSQIQANRGVADTQAKILQEASKLPADQRSGYMLDSLQNYMQGLDAGTPAGRAGISAINTMVMNQLNNALKLGDEKSFQEISARFPTFVNALSGREQQLARTQQQVADINRQYPQAGGQYFYDPVTGAVRFAQTMQPQAEMQPVGAAPMGNISYAPWAQPPAQPLLPAVQQALAGGPVPQTTWTTAPALAPYPETAQVRMAGVSTPAPVQPTQWFRPWVYDAANWSSQQRTQNSNALLGLMGLTPGGAYR